MTIKILVTGGTGLVGHGVQHALTTTPSFDENWVFVGSKDADLTNYEETSVLFKKHKPDYVVHLASMVGGVYKNISQNVNFFITNTLININVLKCCNENNVKKVFSCLSTCVFDENDKLPYTEKSSVNGNVHESNNGYALSKRNIIILNKLFNDQARIDQSKCLFMSFIPCNIFGPHDNFKTGESHFIPSLIKRIYNAQQYKSPLTIYGNGNAKRQFIYSRDLGKLIIWLVRNYNDTEPIILSPDINEEYTISEIVNKTASIFNFSGDILYDIEQSNGVLSRTVTNKKLQKLTNFVFTSYEQAIIETMNWFIQQQV